MSFNFIAPIIDGIKGIINGVGDLFTSDEERLTLQNAAKVLEQKPILAEELTKRVLASAQIGVNLEESKGNWFQRGWRPLIGWTCGITWIFTLLIPVIISCSLWIIHCVSSGHIYPFPIEKHLWEALIWLSGGMLGLLGGFRTIEKIKKVQ